MNLSPALHCRSFLRLSRLPSVHAVPVRHYVKFDFDNSAVEVPYAVKIPQIKCYVRNAKGKVAVKALRSSEQVPTYVDGLKKPTVLLSIERPRLDSMWSGGTLYDEKRVLLLIHNKDEKLVETAVAKVEGLVNDPKNDNVHTLWFNRLDVPVSTKIFVDQTGEKWQEVDYYKPGGLSGDHQDYLNTRYRKQKDDWWMGVEQKISAVDPNWQPAPRGPKAPKVARAKKK